MVDWLPCFWASIVAAHHVEKFKMKLLSMLVILEQAVGGKGQPRSTQQQQKNPGATKLKPRRNLSKQASIWD